MKDDKRLMGIVVTKDIYDYVASEAEKREVSMSLIVRNAIRKEMTQVKEEME